MRISDEAFMDILKEVPGSYDDFVIGLTDFLSKGEEREQMVRFISGHPQAGSSEVIRFFVENFLDLDDYEDDDMLYDDDGNEIGRYGDLVRDGRWPLYASRDGEAEDGSEGQEGPPAGQ